MERFSEDWQASTRNVFHSFFYFGGHLIHQPTIHNLSMCIPAQVRMPGSGQLRSLLVDSLYAAEATCLNEMGQGTTGGRGKLWFLRYEYGYLIGPGKRTPPPKKKKCRGRGVPPASILQDCSSSPGLSAQYSSHVKEKDCDPDSSYFTEP